LDYFCFTAAVLCLWGCGFFAGFTNCFRILKKVENLRKKEPVGLFLFNILNNFVNVFVRQALQFDFLSREYFNRTISLVICLGLLE